MVQSGSGRYQVECSEDGEPLRTSVQSRSNIRRFIGRALCPSSVYKAMPCRVTMVTNHVHCRVATSAPQIPSQVRRHENSGRASASPTSTDSHCSRWVAFISHCPFPHDMVQQVTGPLNIPVKGLTRLASIIRINIYIIVRFALTSVAPLNKNVSLTQNHRRRTMTPRLLTSSSWLCWIVFGKLRKRVNTECRAFGQGDVGTQHKPDIVQLVLPVQLLAEWYTAC
jgi:hypothetical protein